LDALPDMERLPHSERLLLTEFTHRVNNELAAAIGIASMAIARASSDEVRHTLARIRRSLENFARVHHLLQVPDLRTRVDACAHLRTLCNAFGTGQGRITVHARREDSAIRCSVSDNGSGMRAHPHGTGLRIIDALLRDLRGHIEQHLEGEGAAFTVVFPVALAEC
jgi:two-component sensor histidine kinase